MTQVQFTYMYIKNNVQLNKEINPFAADFDF